MNHLMKVILLAGSLSLILLHAINLILLLFPIQPLAYLLARLPYLDAGFLLGFVLSLLFVTWFKLQQRYPYGWGFYCILVALMVYGLNAVFKTHLFLYISAHQNSFPLPYHTTRFSIEILIQLLNIIGLLMIFKSNLPPLLKTAKAH